MGSDDSEAGDDDGDMEVENECEYSDLEAASGDADASDYGVHQFIAKDDAGDPMGSDDSETVEAPEIFVAMLVAPESTESHEAVETVEEPIETVEALEIFVAVESIESLETVEAPEIFVVMERSALETNRVGNPVLLYQE